MPIPLIDGAITKLGECEIARSRTLTEPTFTKINSCLGVILRCTDEVAAAHFVVTETRNYREMLDELLHYQTEGEKNITVVTEREGEDETAIDERTYLSDHIRDIIIIGSDNGDALLATDLLRLLGLQIADLPTADYAQSDPRSATLQIRGKIPAIQGLPFRLCKQ